MQILVAEDDPDITDLIALYIKIWLAGSRGSGRRLEAVDLIVLDVMLPSLSGFKVFQALRSNVTTAAIPIIMVTARADENDRITGLDLGADDYLCKPFSPNELIAHIRALMRRARRGEPAASTVPDSRLRFPSDVLLRQPSLQVHLAERCPQDYCMWPWRWGGGSRRLRPLLGQQPHQPGSALRNVPLEHLRCQRGRVRRVRPAGRNLRAACHGADYPYVPAGRGPRRVHDVFNLCVRKRRDALRRPDWPTGTERWWPGPTRGRRPLGRLLAYSSVGRDAELLDGPY
jgi:CheY-like chemotaxis protein